MVATWQHDDNFGRILAAYGGIFVAGSIAWGMIADGYRPDRWDVAGALVCLAGTDPLRVPLWPSQWLGMHRLGNAPCSDTGSRPGRARRPPAAKKRPWRPWFDRP